MITYHFLQDILSRRNVVDTLAKGIYYHDTQLSQFIRRFMLSMVAELHAGC